MRYITSQVENKNRIVALSTSLANAKDLGEWSGASSQGLFNFPPGVRLVSLEIHIQSVDIDNFEARMRAMTKPTYTSIVQRTKNGKPAIVFVPTRKHVWLTAVDLMTYSTADSGNNPMFIVQCAEELKLFVDKINKAMLPVESHLHHFLHDNLNAEVAARFITSKQDAVDYLTWTLMYRRLTQNPNYYNLQGVSQRHLSDHLSELVENTLRDLETSKFVSIEDDLHIYPLNLGLIARYHYVSHTTMELFSSLTVKTNLKGLLEILASAAEFEVLPVRQGEEELIRKLINQQRFSFDSPKCTDPHVKANALLQAHFSRQLVGGNLAADQKEVLSSASRLLYATVDIISSNGWLSLVLLDSQLLAIKRMTLQRKSEVKLGYDAPAQSGRKDYRLYFMCDSYMGCDQDYKFSVDVKDTVSQEDDNMRE